MNISHTYDTYDIYNHIRYNNINMIQHLHDIITISSILRNQNLCSQGGLLL